MIKSRKIYTSYRYNQPFEGNHNDDAAHDKIEFDTPALKHNLLCRLNPGNILLMLILIERKGISSNQVLAFFRKCLLWR